MRFWKRIIFDNLDGFQELSTEAKQRYITYMGHYHFSQWFVRHVFLPWPISTAILIAFFNIAVILFAEEKIYMTVFFISFPIAILCICKIWKMDKEKWQEWYKISTDRIQNLFFADYKIFTFWKRMYVKRIDKTFYKYLQTDECEGKCYKCSFKLANLLNDPRVTILWFAATSFEDSLRYGHAVLVRNGYILDTNTRRSYKKDQYLKVLKAEIFYEYTLREYKSVMEPWNLKWKEFGIWCDDRGVRRNK